MGVLSTACASAPATSPGPTVAQADAAASPGTPWHWKAASIDSTAPPSYLLGLVGQSGVEHCPDGGPERQWLSVRPIIGRVSVSGPEASVLDPLMDQPVLALGQPTEAPPQPATLEEPTLQPCLPAQMRSDWRMTPRGLLIERSPAPDPEHFRVDAVRPLRELQVRADGEHLLVTLANPVPVALTDVELRVHYEGCFGKPSSMTDTAAVGELGVGAQASIRAIQLSPRPGDPDGLVEFRAYSVQLVGRGEGVVIDLDVPLASLGTPVECPDAG